MFQSLSRIMDSSMEELAQCPGIGEKKVCSTPIFSVLLYFNNAPSTFTINYILFNLTGQAPV